MNFIASSFVFIQIRISNRKLLGYSVRKLIAVAIMLLILNHFIQLIYASNIIEVVSACFMLLAFTYIMYLWIKVWPTVNELLEKADQIKHGASQPDANNYRSTFNEKFH